MWGLLELFLELLGLLPRDRAQAIDQATDRLLERMRWLIYGVIALGVIVLIFAVVLLILAR